MPARILGIRHHGPGSARSVLAELDRSPPDLVLVEGPPDATAIIPLVADPGMRPPVALLLYAPDDPRTASFYPFAEFSPEWVAMRWALAHAVPVRFMDLPAGTMFAMARAAHEQLERSVLPDDTGSAPAARTLRTDPLDELATAAGEADGERLWDRLVESRRDPAGVFAAVLEAMSTVRAELPERDPEILAREAAMRRAIRKATNEGHADVAVICGAWHAPALASGVRAADDERLLRTLPRPIRTAAAWVPWTYDRLAAESGYGAGIWSPGWYEHLWSGAEPKAVSWLARVAAVFRAEGLDASAAQLVDAARLSEALASMRGRSEPSLVELNEAVRACLAMGSELPLALVRQRLIVGLVMGETPPDAPVAPLAADLDRETRRLRMKPEPGGKVVDLDLRAQTDLARSHLLHRLVLLDVPWGARDLSATGSGTFHELWSLAWHPEFAVQLVAASRHGNTIVEAASTRAREAAREAATLPALTRLVEAALLADLRDAVDEIVARVGEVAAVGADVPSLMGALPALARVLRYGNVRGTDATAVGVVVDGLVARICVGLVAAAASLDDDAAMSFTEAIEGVHGAIALLDDPDDRATWRDALALLLDLDGLHGLVAGRTCRLLLDEGAIESAEATRRLRLVLSPGADRSTGAAWAEGFLRGSGTLLLHDDDLFAALDGWIDAMPTDAFGSVLPLLRRTIATFSAPERRAIGERVVAGPRSRGHSLDDDLDLERAALVTPILARILRGPGAPA